MRIIVCGGRDFADRDAVFSTLNETVPWSEPTACGNSLPANVTIIHGGCPTGADRWADDWAVINWTGLLVFPPDWDAHGLAAGPIRNQQMIDEGRPDLVIAFPGGRGTADMLRRARKAGLIIKDVRFS